LFILRRSHASQPGSTPDNLDKCDKPYLVNLPTVQIY
jgi:hypothetical protein